MGLFQKLLGMKGGDAEEANVPWSVPDGMDEEHFVRCCAEAAFTEAAEDRTFRSDPAFQQVLGPLNAEQYASAIKAAAKVVPRFPDFDLPYKWLAAAYLSTDQLQQSRAVLIKGLAKTRRKSLLLTDLGETEWRLGNIHQAVFYWCQALQCLGANPVDYNAYLLLAHVARGCGLSGAEQALLARVDAMQGGSVRIDSTTGERLLSMVRQNKTGAMSRAVQHAVDHHLHSA
ncbi:MAG TPA: hypothetical protein VMR52_00020 [Dehalococcoidia bacterium]|nr:hypothetical protein [Dehalococcoidia bacterium]